MFVLLTQKCIIQKYLDCPISTSVVASDEDNPDFPPSNILVDQCAFDGSNEWRGRGNNSEIVLVLGCRQDVQAVWIKNGLKDFRTQNFTISVATHMTGPWKQVLTGSLPFSNQKVINLFLSIHLKTGASFKADCSKPATKYKLEKSITAKFMRIRTVSFFGSGPGLQYVGIENGKGIDMGIRGEKSVG